MQFHAYFSGKVQGVFMRARAKELADNFGLTGWIKNLPDGRVELVAEGQKEQLENFLNQLKQKFEITQTEIQWSDSKKQLKEFCARYD